MEFKCIAEIAGYEDCTDYDIYRDGRVWSRKSNRFMKGKVDKGYARVKLNGHETAVHRLIALAFIPNPDNHPIVDHENGDSHDNRLSNLRWTNSNGNNHNRAVKHNSITGEYCIFRAHHKWPKSIHYYYQVCVKLNAKRYRKDFNIGKLPLDATQDDIDALYKANPITDEMKKCRDDMKIRLHGEFSSTHRQ
jgi:hypothetical protein